MIDKQDFYHGAALVRLLNDARCERVVKCASGYRINDTVFLLIKYTSKQRSPWRFTFTKDEISQLAEACSSFQNIAIVFVNGGDGISVLTLRELDFMLEGKPGWVSMSRKYNEQYGVAGSMNAFKRKCSLSRWPAVIFEKGDRDLTTD